MRAEELPPDESGSRFVGGPTFHVTRGTPGYASFAGKPLRIGDRNVAVAGLIVTVLGGLASAAVPLVWSGMPQSLVVQAAVAAMMGLTITCMVVGGNEWVAWAPDVPREPDDDQLAGASATPPAGR